MSTPPGHERENRPMVHLAIDEADDEHAVVHRLTPVTDAEYAATPTID